MRDHYPRRKFLWRDAVSCRNALLAGVTSGCGAAIAGSIIENGSSQGSSARQNTLDAFVSIYEKDKTSGTIFDIGDRSAIDGFVQKASLLFLD